MTDNLRIELITVGHELLTGSTVNTNASWIGRSLARVGLSLSRVAVVDDNKDEICSALKEAISRASSFVIFIGGLGPTHDDITLESISGCTGKKLTLNREALSMVKDYYRNKGVKVKITEERLKMAMLPEGAVPLRNNKGAAPGLRLELNGCVIFCLPGVPREMKSIFNSSVKDELIRRAGRIYRKRMLMRIRGIFESSLAPFLRELQKSYTSAYIKSHPKGFHEGISTLVLEIDVRGEERQKVEKLLEEIKDRVFSYIESMKGEIEVLKR
jgi:molybdenum cofactor synthesis domain-containing protein